MAVAVTTSFEMLLDTNGVPLNGGSVTVYAAGTTTPLALYPNSDLTGSSTNPITLDAYGCHAMAYIAAVAYKILVKNSAGVTQSHLSKDNIDPGVPLGSGALAIANGGTGATTAGAALSALGAATAAELAVVTAEVATLSGALASTEKTHIATGTTAQRTGSPIAGDIRHNTTTTEYEAYISGGWDNLMFESANAAATADVLAETAGATFVRPDRLVSSKRVAKALAKITWSGGTPTLVSGSVNVASITDQGVGDITLTFTTAFADVNYFPSVTLFDTSGTGPSTAFVFAQAAGSIRIKIRNVSNSGVDPDAIFVQCWGTQ